MIATVIVPLFIAMVAPWVDRMVGRMAGLIFALVPLACLGWFIAQGGEIGRGEVLSESLLWAPQLNVAFSFRLDALSWTFALLITGIGGVIFLYAGTYLDGLRSRGRFFAWLLLFMAAMLGLVLADNLITLFIFWELTSISSFFLIGFDHQRLAARQAALQSLLVTGAGGLVMLAGLLLMGMVGGSYELSVLLERGDVVRADPLYPPIVALLLVGCFTKSAQFPFHFWLPGAMEAPTPVSAYLHSSTMVKAGVYLLARLNPTLGGTELWFYLLTGVGGVTMLAGGYLAIRQSYLKRILAYSTVSALGTLVLLLGLGSSAAAIGGDGSSGVGETLARQGTEAFTVFLIAHALYKATLFLVAGSIAWRTRVADINRLGGLAPAMPWTAAAGVLAGFSMAGVPPWFGFVGKELLLELALAQPIGMPLLLGVVWVTSAAFVMIAGLVVIGPFFGAPQAVPDPPRDAPLVMTVGPLVLGLAGLASGLGLAVLGEAVLTPVAAAVGGTTDAVDTDWRLWHGVTPALGLSVLALVAGGWAYAGRRQVDRSVRPLDALHRWGPQQWYTAGWGITLRLADRQSQWLQSGSLRNYLVVALLTSIGMIGWGLWRMSLPPLVSDRWVELAGPWLVDHLYHVIVAGLILVGAAGAVHARSRLTAIASLGIVGYGVAMIYVLYGAPDLAITQFLVETLTVLLFVFVFYRLPRSPRESGARQQLSDLAIALAAGAMMSLLVMVVTQSQVGAKISNYFADQSVTVGRGYNIVNVILVDFRALDTLGEIAVLAVSAIGVLALLKLRPPAEDSP